jgi:hypothetical protein
MGSPVNMFNYDSEGGVNKKFAKGGIKIPKNKEKMVKIYKKGGFSKLSTSMNKSN